MSSMIFHSMGMIFSREQHEQTHVEQSQLPHVCGNTLGESAVGQSSCDSSGVQLVGQSSCGSSEVQLVVSRLAVALKCSW